MKCVELSLKHSKIGTKHAALSCDPQKFLTYFGESDDLAEETLKRAENYLVRIWDLGWRKKYIPILHI